MIDEQLRKELRLLSARIGEIVDSLSGLLEETRKLTEALKRVNEIVDTKKLAEALKKVSEIVDTKKLAEALKRVNEIVGTKKKPE